eukprot:3940256-Rhodomonas_salina.2
MSRRDQSMACPNGASPKVASQNIACPNVAVLPVITCTYTEGSLTQQEWCVHCGLPLEACQTSASPNLQSCVIGEPE